MHKNLKGYVSFFMSFLMFCQIGGYGGAKEPKSGSNLSLGQKIQAFFKTTIPEHPKEAAAVGGGISILTIMALVLGIKKPWKDKSNSWNELPTCHTPDDVQQLGAPIEGVPGAPETTSVSDTSPTPAIEDNDELDPDSASTTDEEIEADNSKGQCDSDSTVAPKCGLNLPPVVVPVPVALTPPVEPRSSSPNVFMPAAVVPDDDVNTADHNDILPSRMDAPRISPVSESPSPDGFSDVNMADRDNSLPDRPEAPSIPSVGESPISESPDIKLNDELTVILDAGVKNKIGDFCNCIRLSGAADSGALERRNSQSVQEFVGFLAKIKNERFDSKNITSLIEDNAEHCERLHVIQKRDPSLGVLKCPVRLRFLAGVINPFNRHIRECQFDCIDPNNQVGSSDWKVFKEYLLRNLFVVDDPNRSTRKLVMLRNQ